MKRILSLMIAVVMLLSAFSVSAASGSYDLYWQSSEDHSYVKAVVNGVYEYDDYTDRYQPELIVEVGTTLTIQIPLVYMVIIDPSMNPDKLWYAENNLAYSVSENGVGVDTGACTVTNLNAATYTDEYGTAWTYYKSGITICFNKPGKYNIEGFLARTPEVDLMVYHDFYQAITVVDKGSIAEMHTAHYTDSTVLVNGAPVSFEAYNIGGNNYFKLRDLAMALNGTGKQFEVTWNAEEGAIYINPGQAYTPVGGELVAGNGMDKECDPSRSSLFCYTQTYYGRIPYVLEAKAYTINGNNYFKLRDLCSALDVGVTWDEATSTIGIDTSIPYAE